MSCPRCEDQTPLWLRPEVWACVAVNGFLFLCSVVALYYAYVGVGWLGFAVVGMLFYFFPGYLLAGHVASQVVYARAFARPSAPSRPKWTQQRHQPTRPMPRSEPDDDDDDDDEDAA